MSDEASSEDEINKNDYLEEQTESKPQTKLNRFISKTKEDVSVLSSKAYIKFEPIITPLKNRYVRYSVSVILFGVVVYLYILYESLDINQDLSLILSIVPIALVISIILVFYVTWDDQKLRRFRTPGLYVIALTTIFFVVIFTPVSDLLFETAVARWMTKSTGFLTASIANFFGINVKIQESGWADIDEVWDVVFDNAPSGVTTVGIDAACSGVHSLTVFIAIFLLMIFESRKRLQWNHNVILVTLAGIIGTYIMNLIRILILLSLFYYTNVNTALDVHDYLGYVILIIWLPIFWIYILPLAEKKKIKEERRERRKERKEERQKKRNERKLKKS